MQIDLTPFGFTPTESLVYESLRALGPASGYAVAKHAGIARANAYQALNGLVSKGGAELVDEEPQRFRAIQPLSLLARISAREAHKLDALEDQVRAAAATGEPTLVQVNGLRAIQEIATRTIVRGEGAVECVAPTALLQGLLPALRKREADGMPLALWVLGEEGDFPLTLAGRVPPEEPVFELPVVLLAARDAALVATLGEAPGGYWSSEPLVTALVRSAIRDLTT